MTPFPHLCRPGPKVRKEAQVLGCIWGAAHIPHQGDSYVRGAGRGLSARHESEVGLNPERG